MCFVCKNAEDYTKHIKKEPTMVDSFLSLYFENKVRYQMALVTLPERKQRVQA
jgi:hypothetical protein